MREQREQEQKQENDWTLDDGRVIRLLTPVELIGVPTGTVLTDINGNTATKGVDDIDGDTRFGYLAFGFVRPTPPSDAGTSEREKGHKLSCSWLCFPNGYYPCDCDRAAAPAAEGPREDWTAADIAVGKALLTPGAAGFRALAAAMNPPAAALPGAEAGTPDDWKMLLVWEAWASHEGNDGAATLFRGAHAAIAELRTSKANLLAYAKRIIQQRDNAEQECAALTSEVARLTEERDAARDAMVRYSDYYDREVEHNAALIAERRALTSEVRALREENDTMLRELVAMLPGSRWADVLAARLASPSPTGAP